MTIDENLPEMSKNEKKAESWCCIMTTIYIFLFVISCFIAVIDLINSLSVYFYLTISLSCLVSAYLIQYHYKYGEYKQMYFYCCLPILSYFVVDAIHRVY
jgi:hypothetical protein